MKAALLIRTHVCEMILSEIQGETTAKGRIVYKTNTMAPLLHTNEKIRSTKIDNFQTPTEYVAAMPTTMRTSRLCKEKHLEFEFQTLFKNELTTALHTIQISSSIWL